MRRICDIFIICVMLVVSLTATAQDNVSMPRYDIVSNGIGNEGTFTAEVSVYLKKPDKNVEAELRKAAVHGALFKGIEAGENGKTQRPIADESVAEKHSDFFEKFFNDGAYANYVTLVDGTLRVEKFGKKLYRARSAVIIKKDALRDYLENNHIIESFNDLF